MSKSMMGAAGGLSATDRAKLIPENIREGVILFSGTPKEVNGAVPPLAFWCHMDPSSNLGWSNARLSGTNVLDTIFIEREQKEANTNKIVFHKSGTYRFYLSHISNIYTAKCGFRLMKDGSVVDGSEYTISHGNSKILDIDAQKDEVFTVQLYHSDNSYGSACVMLIRFIGP